MKGNLALDVMFRMVILVVALMILVGLFSSWASRARSKVYEIFGKKGASDESLMVEKDIYTLSEIGKYVEMCRRKAYETPTRSRVCYILKGEFAEGIDVGDFNDCESPVNTIFIKYEPGAGVGVTC